MGIKRPPECMWAHGPKKKTCLRKGSDAVSPLKCKKSAVCASLKKLGLESESVSVSGSRVSHLDTLGSLLNRIEISLNTGAIRPETARKLAHTVFTRVTIFDKVEGRPWEQRKQELIAYLEKELASRKP